MERNLFINDPFSACLRHLAGGKCYLKLYLGNSGEKLIYFSVGDVVYVPVLRFIIFHVERKLLP